MHRLLPVVRALVSDPRNRCAARVSRHAASGAVPACRPVPAGVLAVVALISLLCPEGLSLASTFRVPTARFPKIQAALDVCADGDSVLVAPGTYRPSTNSPLDFHGVDLVLKSDAGPEWTVLRSDCQDEMPQHCNLISFHSGETSAAVVDGFTLHGGIALEGGGIYCTDSSPIICNCIIEGCSTLGGPGGGVSLRNSSALFRDCVIRENEAGVGGCPLKPPPGDRHRRPVCRERKIAPRLITASWVARSSCRCPSL